MGCSYYGSCHGSRQGEHGYAALLALATAASLVVGVVGGRFMHTMIMLDNPITAAAAFSMAIGELVTFCFGGL